MPHLQKCQSHRWLIELRTDNLPVAQRFNGISIHQYSPGAESPLFNGALKHSTSDETQSITRITTSDYTYFSSCVRVQTETSIYAKDFQENKSILFEAKSQSRRKKKCGLVHTLVWQMELGSAYKSRQREASSQQTLSRIFQLPSYAQWLQWLQWNRMRVRDFCSGVRRGFYLLYRVCTTEDKYFVLCTSDLGLSVRLY